MILVPLGHLSNSPVQSRKPMFAYADFRPYPRLADHGVRSKKGWSGKCRRKTFKRTDFVNFSVLAWQLTCAGMFDALDFRRAQLDKFCGRSPHPRQRNGAVWIGKLGEKEMRMIKANG